jgi:hydroxymethylpyrimidine/phosphomethylpyrimidine kinase
MDYEYLFKRLNRQIIDFDGKVEYDTESFLNSFLKTLSDNGYQTDSTVTAQLNDYLTVMQITVRTGIITSTALMVSGDNTIESLSSPQVLKLTEQAFIERWHDGKNLSERLWGEGDSLKKALTADLKNGIAMGQSSEKTLYAMQRAIERTIGAEFKVTSKSSAKWVTELANSADLLIANINDPKAIKQWRQVLKQTESYINKLQETGTKHAHQQLLADIKKGIEKGRVDLIERAVKWTIYDKHLYNLKRIARTEMSTAGHRAVIASTENDETIIGYLWKLSSAHKIDDICDFYASKDSGLGKGVYTKENVPKGKAHPHCTCLILPRVTQIKQKGYSSYEDFLNNTNESLRDKLIPQWAKKAINDGTELKTLIRDDGFGLITQKQFLSNFPKISS